jgi:hypothetical protein
MKLWPLKYLIIYLATSWSSLALCCCLVRCRVKGRFLTSSYLRGKYSTLSREKCSLRTTSWAGMIYKLGRHDPQFGQVWSTSWAGMIHKLGRHDLQVEQAWSTIWASMIHKHNIFYLTSVFFHLTCFSLSHKTQQPNDPFSYASIRHREVTNDVCNEK